MSSTTITDTAETITERICWALEFDEAIAATINDIIYDELADAR